MRRIAQSETTPETALSGRVSVDLSAISDNIKALKRRTAAPHFMAVVKGNGYGHGLVDVARTAVGAGADWLGTAQLSEAITLRQAGITVPVLSWLYLASQTSATIREALEYDVDVSLGSVGQLEVLAGIAEQLGRPAVVHLELDSGLSRGGARKEDWPELVARARMAEQDGTVLVRGIWTHLAWADVPAHPATPRPSRSSKTRLAKPALPDLTRSCGTCRARPTSWTGPNSTSTWSAPDWRFTAWPQRTTWIPRTSDSAPLWASPRRSSWSRKSRRGLASATNTGPSRTSRAISASSPSATPMVSPRASAAGAWSRSPAGGSR
ncbi:alanine racemase [Arthrobacter sp. Hiyo8]|nr:alanine racemase [Arthrobacter sp. Hiyo8]